MATTCSRPRWRRSISQTSSRSKTAPRVSRFVDEVAWVVGRGRMSTGPRPRRDAADLVPGAVPPGPENLVVRALATVGRRARVRLSKRVPAGAGLGGGSSDAAAVLRWAGALDPAVAAGLGADVPFCVVGGRALVGGIGELVEPLGFEAFTAVLVTPGLAVPTPEVYRAWTSSAVRLASMERSRACRRRRRAALGLVAGPHLGRRRASGRGWRKRGHVVCRARPRDGRATRS